jgi:hypothetical protein
VANMEEEVVERERTLQAVGGDVPVCPETADVVDQHVQSRVQVEHFAREAVYLGLRRQVGGERVDRRVVRRGADLGRGRLGYGVAGAGRTVGIIASSARPL